MRHLKRWVRHRARELTFREAVLDFLRVKPEGEPVTPQEKYCRACRESGLDDCASCSKRIGALN